jgi:tetratricopeptide (TPR) repeat protein
MRVLAGFLVALGLLSTPASAATALSLYMQGKYTQAVDAGVAQNDSAGLAVAARAELALEVMREEPCLECLKRAENYARRAVADDPKSVEGHVDIALCLGYQARIIGKFAAHLKRYAEQAREHLNEALAVEPDNEWAWAAMGGWNIEIVRGGGKTLARWLYGASVESGLADFAKAFTKAPDSVLLRYQYALSLAGYDRDAYRGVIEDALARAVSGRPQSAFEAFVQTRARALLQAFRAGDWPEFDHLVRRDQQYP